MSTPASNQRPYSELIILCGPPRSGTTWLNRELCNLSESFPFLPECTLITKQIEQYSLIRHYCDEQRFRAYFGDQETLLNYFRECVARLVDQVAEINQTQNAGTLILKDPSLCLYLGEMKDLLPPHKLIVLLRDPRDVLASMKNVIARKKQKWHLREAANQLVNYYHQIEKLQRRCDKEVIFLRYEDLVAGRIGALRQFLNRDIMSASIANSDMSAIRSKLDLTDPFFSDLYLKATTLERIGSFEKNLTDAEIRHIEDIYSNTMRHWGYESVNSRLTLKLSKWKRNLGQWIK